MGQLNTYFVARTMILQVYKFAMRPTLHSAKLCFNLQPYAQKIILPLATMPNESTDIPSTSQSRDGVPFQPSCVATPARQDSSTGEVVAVDSHVRQATNSGRQIEDIGKEHLRICSPKQRVYKEPRQRALWRCEICRTVFTTSKTCRICEHEMCASCDRDP